ncbi:hypothetical protein OR1_01159 [Geobacter sp. OR-1]|uniref:hypothetical protein n=1 Tax=Geobacter sp. OR-1 TaxID=1266765 RepID=UPI0005445305|nr:hypothetical protein [Geobacter sp. OR-1]GAM08885.1 hypothetical protein OR1_01159 [Geobacter sp. OR-1]
MINEPAVNDERGTQAANDFDRLRRESLARISRLQRKSGNGPLCLALFLAISIVAQQDFSVIPSLPDEVRDMLGRPPSPNMISAALVLYSFSAIILVLTRMVSSSEKYGGIAHVGYLSAFYMFYHFSNALHDNFWAVFAAGMTVMMLESYHLWTLCGYEIRKEKAYIEQLDRKEKSGFNF